MAGLGVPLRRAVQIPAALPLGYSIFHKFIFIRNRLPAVSQGKGQDIAENENRLYLAQ